MNFSFSPCATFQLLYSSSGFQLLFCFFSAALLHSRQHCHLLLLFHLFCLFFFHTAFSHSMPMKDTTLTWLCTSAGFMTSESLFLRHVQNTAVLRNPTISYIFYFFFFYYFYFFVKLKLTISALVFYIIPLLLCNLHLDLFLSPLCELICALILSIVVILSNICTLVC